MCDCDYCKFRSSRITPEAYKKILENNIIGYKKTLADGKASKHDIWCADTNMDFAKEELDCMASGELKPINKEKDES